MPRNRLQLGLPSPAMIVAVAALFVALGGTGYAMSQLAKNSVGTPQLKNNAVTSVKVRNGTLLSADFKAGQLKAGPPGPAGPAGPKGDNGPAGTGATLAWGADVGDAPKTTSSTTLSTVGSTKLTIPTGETATVVATFSAESLCRNGTATTWCVLRLFIDGTEMNPEDGTNFAFDAPAASTALASYDYEAHSITRIRRGIGAGEHTITAQFQSSSATGPTFRLDDWSLVAVAYKQ